MYGADYSSPMIKFLARLCCRSGASMGQFLARLCCRVGASMGQFLARLWGSFWLVYGADFGSTVSTWCVYVARSKKFLACVCLNAPYPLCAFKNGLRHKRAQTITSTWAVLWFIEINFGSTDVKQTTVIDL